ncbi:MAG: glycosyltransferase [Spirochaetaceae bacterium]|nr:MAG: glycosyltransferase [Spirochaetaceae bacterium]
MAPPHGLAAARGCGMISIIIPAHNEETVIERCLAALLDGAEPGELELIVACNGCSDATAEKARSFGPPVQVIEIAQASKTAAINAAERLATAFPRLYVDADVVLPLSGARAVAETLQNGHLLASPVADTDLGASSAAVRAFYDIWLRLPYNRVMVGTGVYALSKEGRARFGEFPPIIADDGYVRSRFAPQERVAVPEAKVRVVAPRTLGDLVRVKTRVRQGLYQLQTQCPGKSVTDSKDMRAVLLSLPKSLALPWQMLVYLTVNAVVRFRARRARNANFLQKWHRDDAARIA